MKSSPRNSQKKRFREQVNFESLTEGVPSSGRSFQVRLVGDGCQLDRRHCQTAGASRTNIVYNILCIRRPIAAALYGRLDYCDLSSYRCNVIITPTRKHAEKCKFTQRKSGSIVSPLHWRSYKQQPTICSVVVQQRIGFCWDQLHMRGQWRHTLQSRGHMAGHCGYVSRMRCCRRRGSEKHRRGIPLPVRIHISGATMRHHVLNKGLLGVRENVWGNSKKRKKSCFFLDLEKRRKKT